MPCLVCCVSFVLLASSRAAVLTKDSPFVALGQDMRIDDRWVAMLNDWLSGATPGKTKVASKNAKRERG